MSDISREEYQTVHWKPLTEDTEFKDHYWYLLATTKYGTAVKAKFHNDVNHFEILTQSGSEYVYSWEWEGYITHYMEIPKLPWEIQAEREAK